MVQAAQTFVDFEHMVKREEAAVKTLLGQGRIKEAATIISRWLEGEAIFRPKLGRQGGNKFPLDEHQFAEARNAVLQNAMVSVQDFILEKHPKLLRHKMLRTLFE